MKLKKLTKPAKLISLLLACALLAGCGAAPAAAEGGRQLTAAKAAAAFSSAPALRPLAAQGNAAANGGHTVSTQSYTFYLKSLNSTLPELFPLYFIDGVKEIPYVELTSFVKLMPALYSELVKDKGYRLSMQRHGNHVTLTRESPNEFTMDLDFDNNILYFDDYDAFIQPSGSKTLLDIMANRSYDGNGKELLFHRDEEASFSRYGKTVTADLNDYSIELIAQGGKFYLPLQTVSDFLVAPLQVCLLFNGKSIYAANDSSLYNYSAGRYSNFAKSYYTASPAKRSDALAEFSYNELCLMLDTFYGLKDQHSIDRFAWMFWEIEYDAEMQSSDPGTADRTLKSFIDLYLDDQHSSFTEYSWMTGKGSVANSKGSSARQTAAHREAFRTARAAKFPNGCPDYQEVGDTAYITFDRFSLSASAEDYYSGKAKGTLPDDTVGLIVQAHEKITRSRSPIRNVVLDLSNNRGGNVDAAVFTLSWLLGDASISVRDTATDGMSTSVYRADVNLDGKFDAADTLQNVNLFCLVSPVSFSCGSLVPAALKASQKATIIGQYTGGGSCVIQPYSTAHGSVFQISGPMQLSFMKNGSFYDIDLGVDPDVYLAKIASFYDRAALTRTIDAMP